MCSRASPKAPVGEGGHQREEKAIRWREPIRDGAAGLHEDTFLMAKGAEAMEAMIGADPTWSDAAKGKVGLREMHQRVIDGNATRHRFRKYPANAIRDCDQSSTGKAAAAVS